MIAYCGLNCETCPIHLVTLESDKAKQKMQRAEIARLCSEQYGMPLTSEDVGDCDGCRADTGRIFAGCFKCGIRVCARKKGLSTCAACPDYACTTLLHHFQMDPSARVRLDELRNR